MRTIRLSIVTALTGIAAVGLTACGGSSDTSAAKGPAVPVKGSGDNQTVTIKGNDMLRFSPMHITAQTGTLKVTLVDSGSYPHNIEFTTLHVKSGTVSGDPGNGTTSVTLHLSKPGQYPFICTYHSTAGMKGVLTVTS